MRLAVVHQGRKVDEATGEVFDNLRWILCEDGKTKGNIPQYVRNAEPTVFVATDPSVFLAQLQDAFQYDPTWHYTLTRTNQEIMGMGMARVKLRTFGFRGEGVRKQRLHQCWDPRGVSPTPFHRFIEGDVTHESVMEWAMDVREWARSQDLELRNAFAGYASQLLRDPRFYPHPRRKVPRATNEKARPSLPGNLIQLYVKPGPTPHDVTAIDQRSAHHRIAQNVPIPSANTLYARGYYGDPEGAEDPWAQRGTRQYQRTIRQPGLIYAGVHSRRTLAGEYRLPVQDFQGYQRVFLYTNMVPFLEATGSHVECIYAAWTSNTADTGLARYGAWAQQQIENAPPHRRSWLKPLLHSTYGLLAARPRPLEIGHRQAKGGKHDQFLLGAREFPVRMIALKDWQPITANVIQRGVIESETQLRSLRMAQSLQRAGCRVLHIHTDGLHVDGQLPLLPDDWAVSALTRVTYLDRVSWVSEERTCLPGRDEQQRAEVVQHYADLHATLSERRSRGRLRSRAQRKAQRARMEAGDAGDA